MSKKQRTESTDVQRSAHLKWWELLEVKENDCTVLLLNAHGGINPKTKEYMTEGKRSPEYNGRIFYEGEGMRKINLKIKTILDLMGVKCIIVNDTWKDTPIHTKREMVLKLGLNKKNAFALECHANATKNLVGGARGFEVFTYPGKSESDPQGVIYGEEFENGIPGVIHRRYTANKEKEARFGILKLDPIVSKEKGIPIVLTECGFMDDEAFCKAYLMTEWGLDKIAAVHIKAIVRIVNEFYHAYYILQKKD